MRPVFLPPKDLAQRKFPLAGVTGQQWIRCHKSRLGPVHYSCSENHRFTPFPRGPKVIYLAPDEETAVMEVFGDQLCAGKLCIPASSWNSCSLSTLQTDHILYCDLNDLQTRLALGVELGTLLQNDLSVCQAWADAIFSHPSAPQAIVYPSRFTKAACLCLREEMADRLLIVSEPQPLPTAPAMDDFLNEMHICLV